MLGLEIGIAITITSMAFATQHQPRLSPREEQKLPQSTVNTRYHQQWEKFSKQIDKRIDQLKRSKEKARTQQEIDNLNARIEKLQEALMYLYEVSNSQEHYVLSRIGGDEGGLFFSKKEHAIGIQYVSKENFIHEMMHLWQYERNKIAYDTMVNKAILQDVYDEIQAYKMQFAYDPSSVQTLVEGMVITSMDDITPEWILQIKKATGYNNMYMYAQHGRVDVDMDSRIDRLEDAYNFDIAVVHKLREVFEGDKSYRTVWIRDLKFKPENNDLSATKKIHRP